MSLFSKIASWFTPVSKQLETAIKPSDLKTPVSTARKIIKVSDGLEKAYSDLKKVTNNATSVGSKSTGAVSLPASTSAFAPVEVSSPVQANSAVQAAGYDAYSSYLPLGSSSYDMEQYYQMLREISDYNTAQSVQMARENNQFNAEQAALSRQFNAAEAAKNRDWQEMMSNTAHQREIADLQAAGLNPVLSAMGGSGATVTSGATASSTPVSGTKGDVDKSFVQGLASIIGTLVSAQSQMMNTLTNAQNNLAVADKYNATSELIAQINAAAGIKSAGIHAGGTITAASLAADASRFGSWLSSEASKYGSDLRYAASKYAADIGAEASKYGSDLAAFSNLLRSIASLY